MKRNILERFNAFWGLLFLALLVALVLSQSNPYKEALSRDNGFFLYAGSQILKGKIPYIDFWDSKGPIIFYINAFGLLIGKGSRWGVWFLEFVFLFVESAVFFRVVQKKWGHGAALFSSIAWLYGISRVFEGGNFTEEYSLFLSFISLAYFISLDGKDFNNKFLLLLGLALVVNFMFRANNIGVPLLIFLSISFSQLFSRKYRQLAQTILVTLLAAVASFLIISLYFSQKGIFAEMIEASILYNFFYSQAHHAFYLSLWRGIGYIGWPAFIAFFGYLAVLYQVVKDRSLKSLSSLKIFVLFLFPLEVILSSISGRSYLHYFISWMPAVAVLSAISFSAFSEHIFSMRFLDVLEDKKNSFLLLLPIVLVIYMTTGIFGDYQETAARLLFHREKGVEYNDPLADFLRENTEKEDTILAWGVYPSINYLTKRDAPTPFLFYPAYERSPYTEDMALAFSTMIAEAPPAMIVDMYSKAPDYILSIDPVIRAAQIEREGILIFEKTPYQNAFFNFAETHYKKIITIEGFDIYSLISDKE